MSHGHDLAAPLRAEADDDDDRNRDDARDQREREPVIAARRLGDLGLERAVVGSQEIACLIDEARQGRAHRARREFIEMGGNDAPGALAR